MTCKDCAFATQRSAFMRCQNHGLDTMENAVICSEFRHKTQTNGDRIRAMSDEELAKHLICQWDICRNMNIECDSCLLDWLKQDAENE